MSFSIALGGILILILLVLLWAVVWIDRLDADVEWIARELNDVREELARLELEKND